MVGACVEQQHLFTEIFYFDYLRTLYVLVFNFYSFKMVVHFDYLKYNTSVIFDLEEWHMSRLLILIIIY